MGRSGEAINTAVLAPTIRIDADFKADIRTLIVRDDRFGRVAKILRRTTGLLVRIRIFIDNIGIGKIDMQLFESIGRAP